MKIRRVSITASEHEHRGVAILYTDKYEADVKDKHLEALEFEEIVRLIDGELDAKPDTSTIQERRYKYFGPVFRGREVVDTIPQNAPLETVAVSKQKASSNFREQLRKRFNVTQHLYSIDDAKVIEGAEEAKWTRSRLSNAFRMQYADDSAVGLNIAELEATMDPFYNNVDGLRDKIVDCLCEAVPNIFTADQVRLDIDPRIDVPDYQFIIDDVVVFIDIDTNGEPFVTEW